MKNFKKILSTPALLYTALFAIIWLSPFLVLAEVIEIPNPIAAGSFPELIDRIADWLLRMGLIISTGVIIWSAYLFLFAGGSKERVTQARQTLLYAIVGIVILLLAKGVTSIIVSFFEP